MDFKLNIAIIGASGAIGHALAEYYAQQSVNNFITAFSRQPLSFSRDQIQNSIIDFDSEKSVEQCSQLMTWDLVIIAMGILQDNIVKSPEKSFKHITEENFLHVLKVNTFYPALVAKYFLPQLSKQKSVFAILSARVGSIGDNRKGGWYSYRASKAALNMLIKNFSIEMQWFNKQAIIIGLHPGTVDSRLSQPFQSNVPSEQLFPPAQAAGYLATVLSNVTTEQSGQCLDWQGTVVMP